MNKSLAIKIPKKEYSHKINCLKVQIKSLLQEIEKRKNKIAKTLEMELQILMNLIKRQFSIRENHLLVHD